MSIAVERRVVLIDEGDGATVTVERIPGEEDSRDGGQAYGFYGPGSATLWVSLAELREFALTILDTFPANS